MLLVGTSHGLRDLESGEKFVDGMAVTALAPGGTEGWYALLDCRSVVRLDRDMAGTVPAGELPEPDGQSLVVLPDGTVVVGRTGPAFRSSAHMARSVTSQRSKQCPAGTAGRTRRAPRRARARWPPA